MATAKQIAARKRFAEMARSGKLATMRQKAAKKSAKKSTTKRNPAPKKQVQTKRGGCNPEYFVQIKKGKRWVTVGSHGAQAAAEAAAVALNESGLTAPIRVWG